MPIFFSFIFFFLSATILHAQAPKRNQINTINLIIGYYDWANPCPCIKVKDRKVDVGSWPGIYAYTYNPDTILFGVQSFDVVIKDDSSKETDRIRQNRNQFSLAVRDMIMNSDSSQRRNIFLENFNLINDNKSTVQIKGGKRLSDYVNPKQK